MIQKIADRILFYVFLKPISYLPLGVLYLFSDIGSFIIYHFVKYRKKVVRQNLKNAFPGKSMKEIKVIERNFYRHFSDFLVESIKAISISQKELEYRTSFKNLELINQLHSEGHDIIVTCGHFNNWEFYALRLPQVMKYSTYSVYQPLKNKFYDNILYSSRTRKGMKLISTKEVIPFFSTPHVDRRMVVMVNDQSPSKPEKAHWNEFMNQETGWNTGPEKLARKYDFGVVFGHSRKVKRGHYEVEFTLITTDSSKTKDGQIIDEYSKMLAELIHEHPECWLWSHKRWKHKKKSSQVNNSVNSLPETDELDTTSRTNASA